jgi:type IV secretory pathway VirB10-like protein
VQVDGAGRLTVRGQRSDAAANARHSRFNKVFQLPSTSNLDDIAGRFDLGVLTLTVPKRLPAPAKEDQQQAKKPEDAAAAAATKGAKSEPEQQHKEEAAAKEDKPKAAAAAAAPAPAADTTAKEDKPKAAAAAPAPAADTKKQPETQANAESKATDPTESLAERRTEEERANANAAAAAEHQRKACRGFKERVAEELQGLAGSEWAEGLVETVKRNREVIAVAVAAFSLGVFVSSRLFSRSSRN